MFYGLTRESESSGKRDINGKFLPKGKYETVVSAARSIQELYEFVENAAPSKENFVAVRLTELKDHMVDPDLRGYRKQVPVFIHASLDEQNQFIYSNGIMVCNSQVAKEYHNEMVDGVSSYSGYSLDALASDQTIGDMYNINVDDKWDQRSEEQKAAANDQDEYVKKLKQRMGDAITGSSFDPNPRGDNGGLKIGKIEIDGSNVSMSGHKVSSKKSNTQIDLGLTDNSIPTFEDMITLSKRIQNDISDEAIQKIKEKFEAIGLTDEEKINLRDELLNNAVKKEVNEAIKPIKKEDLKSTDKDEQTEEVLDIYRESLINIPELSREQIDDILEQVRENLNKPQPMPEDYMFALDEELTASPSMRGVGTPIIHIKRNPVGPNAGKFRVNDGDILFEQYGLEMVSGGLYSFEKKVGDSKYSPNIVDTLLAAGFVENENIIPKKHERLLSTSGRDYTPEELAKAMAGDGTSTVSGTGSFGKHKVTESIYDMANDIQPGLVGEQAGELDQDSALVKTEWNDLPDVFKQKLDDYITKDRTNILFGPYVGASIKDTYSVVVGVDEKWMIGVSANIRHLTTNKIHGIKVVTVSIANNAAKGVFTIRTENGWKIYIL